MTGIPAEATEEQVQRLVGACPQAAPIADTEADGSGIMCERLVAHLKARADSYSRDARNLLEDGDRHAAVAYSMIAEELRRCVEVIGETR